MTGRRRLGAGCVVIGAAALTACVQSVSTGMQDVMRRDGRLCASGGPYVGARQCSGSDVRLLLVGIIGGLIAVAILTGGSSALGRPRSSAGLLAWASLFGLLGWNFISFGLHRAAGQDGTVGWLFNGAVFWLLALGGLVPFLSGLRRGIRTAGRPDPVATGTQPLVRAAFVPGTRGGQSGASGQSGDGIVTSRGFDGPGLDSTGLDGTGLDGPGFTRTGLDGTGLDGAGAGAWLSARSSAPILATMPIPAIEPVATAKNLGRGWLALWLVLMVAGVAVGAAASSALVSLLS